MDNIECRGVTNIECKGIMSSARDNIECRVQARRIMSLKESSNKHIIKMSFAEAEPTMKPNPHMLYRPCRSRWKPERNTMIKVATMLMNAGCATALEYASLQVEHVQPLDNGVYC